MPTPIELEAIRKNNVAWLCERGFNPANCGLYRLTNKELDCLVKSIDRTVNLACGIGRAIEASSRS